MTMLLVATGTRSISRAVKEGAATGRRGDPSAPPRLAQHALGGLRRTLSHKKHSATRVGKPIASATRAVVKGATAIHLPRWQERSKVGIEHTRPEHYIIMASPYPPAGVARRQEAPGVDVDSSAVWTRSAPARQSFQSGGRRSELFRSFRSPSPPWSSSASSSER
jgi:hypothetical protein